MESNDNNREENEEELVTVDGIQFKNYLFRTMEVLAKAQKYENMKQFIEASVVLNLQAYLENIESDCVQPLIGRLNKEGLEITDLIFF